MDLSENIQLSLSLPSKFYSKFWLFSQCTYFFLALISNLNLLYLSCVYLFNVSIFHYPVISERVGTRCVSDSPVSPAPSTEPNTYEVLRSYLLDGWMHS